MVRYQRAPYSRSIIISAWRHQRGNAYDNIAASHVRAIDDNGIAQATTYLNALITRSSTRA